jgi:Na+-translocating ferredoxin:NAD+ oxidoreductase subunit B
MGRLSKEHRRAYRKLQRHLDRQAVGFPATLSGAEIRFLSRMFTPEEARLALHLTYRPSTLQMVSERSKEEFSKGRTEELLESLLRKGTIGYREENGVAEWFLLPLVIGMYEAQDGKPTRSFLRDAGEYMKTLGFGVSFLSARPSQMRTIPIGESIPVNSPVATYDQAAALIENSSGPFVILPCICREAGALRGKPCKMTKREETCLALGSMSAMILKRGHGREITREEALDILSENVEEGLVLQPGNAKDPEFICSCCGCCCGMLQLHKMLPRPVDFWTSSYLAEVNEAECTGCGICEKRCQVNAVSVQGKPGRAVISAGRCIGCGLCVPTCPAECLRLIPRDGENVPPDDTLELYDTIRGNRKGKLGELGILVKILFRRR